MPAGASEWPDVPARPGRLCGWASPRPCGSSLWVPLGRQGRAPTAAQLVIPGSQGQTRPRASGLEVLDFGSLSLLCYCVCVFPPLCVQWRQRHAALPGRICSRSSPSAHRRSWRYRLSRLQDSHRRLQYRPGGRSATSSCRVGSRLFSWEEQPPPVHTTCCGRAETADAAGSSASQAGRISEHQWTIGMRMFVGFTPATAASARRDGVPGSSWRAAAGPGFRTTLRQRHKVQGVVWVHGGWECTGTGRHLGGLRLAGTSWTTSLG